MVKLARMRKWYIFLGLITIFAAILRLYQLGVTPNALEWDEVALGYDAFSILKTCRDQFNQFFPLTFRSLDDYKPPIYEYLAVPSVALFGLNPFAVRLPSALSGILMVFTVFFLARIIFKHTAYLENHRQKASLLASFLLAVSPWHIQFSRAAFEVNVAAAVTVLAVYSFLKGLTENRYFILSALFFGITLFSYHSARVVSPLLFLSLFILFNN